MVCATLNVALIHSRPYKPRGRGKVERFFRHVRSAFLPHVTPEMLADLGALNRVLWAWLEGEYHQTPHWGLAPVSMRSGQGAEEIRLRLADLSANAHLPRATETAEEAEPEPATTGISYLDRAGADAGLSRWRPK